MQCVAKNVFVTFSLTELGMARHWMRNRHKESKWKSQLAIHGIGLLMCLCILFVTLSVGLVDSGAIQRHLQFEGMQTVVLPIRIF